MRLHQIKMTTSTSVEARLQQLEPSIRKEVLKEFTSDELNLLSWMRYKLIAGKYKDDDKTESDDSTIKELKAAMVKNGDFLPFNFYS